MENRKEPRIKIQMRTQLSLKGQAGGEAGQLRDLSINGCRLAYERPLPDGTEVQLSLYPREFLQPVIINSATVCWTKNGENGLRFNEMRGDAKKRLSLLCRQIIL